jgi:LPXTG-motif cell wall-anchored protein
VTVTLHSAPVVLGTARTNSSGSFVKTFTLPNNVTLGAHQITLDGVDAAGDPVSLVLSLNVESLPATGAPIRTIAMFALLLLMCGGAFVFGVRRKEILS